MARKKTTVYVEEDLLRSAKVLAARTDRTEYEVFEEALKQYLGLDVLEKVWRREGLPEEEEATRLAYEELHAMRAEEREAAGGPASSAG
ncbi:MAG: hypothetical protein H0V53_08430 [Rubrobacter sp.]|jgi:predicted transcriptional regulator|nr:hypothetical protein [Rubrobacter sp.]